MFTPTAPNPFMTAEELLRGSEYSSPEALTAAKLSNAFHPRDYAWPEMSSRSVRRILNNFASQILPCSRQISFLGDLPLSTPIIPREPSHGLEELYQQVAKSLTGLPLISPYAWIEHELWDHLLEIVIKNRPGRSIVLVADSLCPLLRYRLRRKLPQHELTYVEIPTKEGTILPASLLGLIHEKTAAVVAASPNYFGCFESMSEIGQMAHQRGALLVAVTDLLSLSLARSPGEYRANICVADWQTWGPMPARLGGRRHLLALSDLLEPVVPLVSFMEGQQAIGASQLIAQTVSTAPPKEFDENFRQVWTQAHFLRGALSQIPGSSWPHPPLFFRQFVLHVPVGALEFIRELEDQGLIPGVPLADYGYPKEWLLVRIGLDHTASDLEYFLRASRHAITRLSKTKLSS